MFKFMLVYMIMSFTNLLAIETVNYVDIQKYSGTWYEHARFENSFQEDCLGVRATYSILSESKLKVLNECIESKTGKINKAIGRAKIRDKKTNAKLDVTFIPIPIIRWIPSWFTKSGNYWVYYLDQDYQNVIVGSPNKDYLWFLGREKEISPQRYEELKDIALSKGFDVEKLNKTPIWQ